MPKSKVSAFLSVLLVFASGAAMGAAGYRLYVVKTVASSVQPPSKKKMTPEDFRKRLLSHLNDAVKLSDQELTEVQKIYDSEGEQFDKVNSEYDKQVKQAHHDFDEQLNQLHESSVAKIKAILTPAQELLYEKWLAERAARAADHKRHQEQQQQQGPGPHNKDGRRPPLP